MNRLKPILLTFTGFLFLFFIKTASCSLVGADAFTEGNYPENGEHTEEVYDPFEPWNQVMFGFNQIFDDFLFMPFTEIYQEAVPDIGKQGVHNFLKNLTEPLTFLHDVVQGDMDRAMTTLARFLINTTQGIFGLIDVADEWGLDHHQEDAGQTAGSYGVGPGPYIVLPLLGPSNVRDTIGMVADFFIDPFNILAKRSNNEDLIRIRYAAMAGDKRHQLRDFIREGNKKSDPYVYYRSVYNQNRKYLIRNEQPPEESPVPSEDLDEVEDYYNK